MTKYEELEEQAKTDNVDIILFDFKGNLHGLYCDNNIALKKDDTIQEKTCILAEELGHHYTTVGNILDMSVDSNRKQEYQARLWGYNRLIGLQGIIKAHKAHCKNAYEAAEYLNVTVDYLLDALTCYKEKYGTQVKVDDYVIFFEPMVNVLEK